MQINFDASMLILYSLTAVGIIQWTKTFVEAPKWVYSLALPFVAMGAAFSTLVPPLDIGLQVWAFAQLTYPILVQLPEKLLKKVG